MGEKVIGIGEVLWDLLPKGPQLGGAPGNFAWHAGQLGATAAVISRVGRDELGDRALGRLREMKLDAGTVQTDPRLPTGTAGVTLDATGTPHFTITTNVAWDALAITDEALTAVCDTDAICFGTLAQRTSRSVSVIMELVAATPVSALRVFDVNLRESFYGMEVVERSLKAANVLKLNESELAVLTPMLELAGDVNRRIEQLADRFELQLVALTRGENGSLLYRKNDRSELPGRKLDIVDTVGAGDAFTAAMVMGLLHQFSLADIHRIASEVANFVCTQAGGTPVLPGELRAAFSGD